MHKKPIFFLIISWFSVVFFVDTQAFSASTTYKTTSSRANAVRQQVEKPVRDSVDVKKETQKQRERWLAIQEEMLEKIEQLESENSRLSREKEALSRKISDTKERIALKQKELLGLERIEKDMGPFIRKTLAWLRKETASGMPFLKKERSRRISHLEKLVDDPALPLSEKFRKLMEVLLIEAEYGTTVEVTNDTIELEGEPVFVNVLRLGRLNLFYQSLDEERCGLYDPGKQTWRPLSGSYNRNIRRAMDMAMKRRPVEIVTLPVGRVVKR